MKNIFKLAFVTILLGNTATFFAASSSRSEKGKTAEPYKDIVEAIDAHDPAGVQHFIQRGIDRNRTLLHFAINGIDTVAYRETFKYQPGTREVIQLLLAAGFNPNAKNQYGSTPLCLIYRKINTLNQPVNRTDRVLLLQKLYDIAQDIEQAGGTCNIKMRAQERDQKIIAQHREELARKETKKAQEMFADRELKRPLLSEIVGGPIAEYLGVPQSAQQKAKERMSEEEEKEKAAARTSQTTTAPVKKSNAKSLDE